ncbi:prepilin-type N-terminal cleavage/methylation domain-containing protein [Novosphingobium sp.]|uniref:prepilin-type N-terminal cleavage/methylation domain-containing protein n=1 Tax=Novosphingobium sp. TaxID=1874826 RepID=UPI00333FC0F0
MTLGRPAHEAGFSLIEALVALAIIAAMTLTLFATMTADARARRMVRERRAALMVAQSQLDRAVGGDTETAGTALGLAWQIERDNYGNAEAFAHGRLEQLTITVGNADHQQLARLATMRIAP